jgi:predicted nucleic acid-binding protein
MKKVFVDTNIFIDLIADRRPFSKFAIDIFEKAESKKVKLYTSSHIFATTYYLLKKYIEEKEMRNILTNLLEYVSLVAVDSDIIKRSLKSKYKDFEDAIQIYAAHSVENIDYIVTRNLRDYRDAGIVVLPPDELVKLL